MPEEKSPAATARPLNAAIVGGGRGCESFLRMIESETLQRFRLRVLGVADVDLQAPGIQYARQLGVPLISSDWHRLLEIPELDLIIELTGQTEVRDQIEEVRPSRVHLIDHFAARLFWELHQAEEAVIEQRRLMQERLEAERARVAQILDSIPDEIVVLDRVMVVQDANASFLRNNRLSIEQVRGKHCYELDQLVRGECQVAMGNCPFFEVLREGQPRSFVRKHFGPEGQTFYASIVGAPLLDASGQVTGMIEMVRDITRRILLEENLRGAESRLRQFMEFAPLACFVKNQAGQYVDINNAGCQLFGRGKAEIIGKTDLELLPRQAAEILRQGDRDVWLGRQPLGQELDVTLGGRHIFFSAVKFPVFGGSGEPTALCVLLKDVTDQRLAERQLEQTRNYLQSILDNSPVIIITTDIEGRVVSFNKGAEKSLGYRAEEVIGKPATIFYQDPSQRQEFLRRILQGRSLEDYSFELLRKDGTLLPVSITMAALRDSDGNMIGTVGMSKDISQRKALIAQVMQSERLAAVGRVASGVAHEINNPTAVIGEIAGYLEMLLKPEVPEEERHREMEEGLRKIKQQVIRIRDITRRLLTFSRKTEARVETTQVNAALDEILGFLQKEAVLGKVTIHRDYQPHLPAVAIEEMQLQEVFINLISNAIYAVAHNGGGNVWLSTRAEGGKVLVSVRDDGPGIDPSVRPRLFEPFVTTKPTGEGTGLGLSICYGIVKRYDGEIRVRSEPGQGTDFTVILPPALQIPDTITHPRPA